MFTLESNKRSIWYAKYLGEQERMDAHGYRTLTHDGKYGEPTEIFVNIADRTGNPQLDAFGIDTDYSMQIVDDLPMVFAEGDIVWVKVTPAGGTPADYFVSKAASTLTHAIYALRERTKKWNTV